MSRERCGMRGELQQPRRFLSSDIFYIFVLCFSLSFSMRLSYKFFYVYFSRFSFYVRRPSQRGLFPEHESSETYIGRQPRRVAEVQRVSSGKGNITVLCVTPVGPWKKKSTLGKSTYRPPNFTQFYYIDDLILFNFLG